MVYADHLAEVGIGLYDPVRSGDNGRHRREARER